MGSGYISPSQEQSPNSRHSGTEAQPAAEGPTSNMSTMGLLADSLADIACRIQCFAAVPPHARSESRADSGRLDLTPEPSPAHLDGNPS